MDKVQDAIDILKMYNQEQIIKLLEKLDEEEKAEAEATAKRPAGSKSKGQVQEKSLEYHQIHSRYCICRPDRIFPAGHFEHV